MTDQTMRDQKPEERARTQQQRAADPAQSAFVTANAGSGKTTVLVDRVLRLLLTGVPPGKILCLTYTKAAAANMALKVFERLSGWTGMEDKALVGALDALTARAPEPAEIVRARRLFAQAVETPGGLKIETIHAFCERVLHLFPFEANVPARFEVLDDAAAEELLAAARSAVLVEAARGSDADLKAALSTVSLEAAGQVFDAAVRAALAERAFLRAHRARGAHERAMTALSRALGLAPGESLATIERDMIEGGIAPREWPSIADLLMAGKSTDRAGASALREACAAQTSAEMLEGYLKVFFTKDNQPRSDKRFLTGAIDLDLVERLRAERERLAVLAEKRRAAAVMARTNALLMLAGSIFARVEAMKIARGALDFQDLIDKTLSLLERSGAGWVLYKLDAGVDHVLVDEAQDTSPAQWRILKALTEDFAAGAGARAGLARTVFAVGDTKQSIFGFQGADPRALAETSRYFRRALQGAGQRFEDVSLSVSFRSAPAVLDAVDAVFAQEASFRGLAFDDDDHAVGTTHESSRPREHGRVELWPLVRPRPAPEPDAWSLPVDEPDASAPPVVLAERIARAVRRWTVAGAEDGRRVSAGEVLVLVRKRGPLFEAIIRALKRVRVPVAGADRLRLGEHIAVLDLIAAGRAALLPDDDLTLATALKTPLVAFDDDDLIRIGARRAAGQSLAAALREAADHDGRARDGLRHLEQWRELARRHGPFGFYAMLLGPLGARRILVSRLGPEAADAIDELLALALAHERRGASSLAGFLASFGDAVHEVKRDMDASRGEVRVMTVHGAKGLEADTVIIADPCRFDPPRPILMPVACGGAGVVPAWTVRRDEEPSVLSEARERLKAAEREEHNRLLYVAMTRAKSRLVIAPHIGRSPNDPPIESWLAMVETGLARAREGGLVDAPFLDGEPGADELIRVWQGGTQITGAPADGVAAAKAGAPPWLHRPVAPEPEREPPLRPSSALAAADAAAAAGSRGPRAAGLEARLVGTLVHALLQHLPSLPEADREAAAARFVAARAARLDAAVRARIVSDALTMIGDPRLAALFGPSSRAEASVVGKLRLIPGGEPLPVSGQIDRLADTEKAVMIVDFKTTARPPAGLEGVSETILTQLAVYEALLTEVFKGKPVRAFLAYTADATVLEVPPGRLAEARAALARAHAGGSRPRDAHASMP